MEVKRFFVVAKKVPDIHSCQVVVPQNLKLSDLQASQPNQSCVANVDLGPVLPDALKTWLCLWFLLTEEDREYLGCHWCGKVGRDQQFPAGPSQSYFLSPFFNNHKPIDTWKVVVNTWTTSFSKNQSFLTISTIDKVSFN